MAVDVPIVLIAFNRPRVTERVIRALRSVEPSQVFVVADGPRPGHATDEETCAAVRALIDQIDWDCKVHKRYADTNLGLEANVELGLDWVFDQVDRAIVFEDDCIPDPSFFDFCTELLDRYQDDERVWLISGDKKGVPQSRFHGRSYAFSSWASVWGWATWGDRWRRHRELFPRTHEGASERAHATPRTADAVRVKPAPPADGALATPAGQRHFLNVSQTTNGDHYGWDHHFWVTIISEGGLCATPSLYLVENDGFGPDATHTRASRTPRPAQQMQLPLVHPPEVALDREVELELELVLLRIDGRVSRLAKRIIRPLWLRKVVRRIVTFPPVWKVARKLVAR
ncbi:hypothetical protein [Nocardioides bizhenqiangii]|uniref:Glycosyltransferase family 2 protein n=1 Tax=Nocardioides bizhenqiangii TaxID=3095076 RepID=A0ABZ0ZPI9_9ACTN|nr:hypothetical protein [Nocardioides sp. HM61]WQQ25995.1 hypothetical protein SHK19_18750 [Nocardioides sp. HM61]